MGVGDGTMAEVELELTHAVDGIAVYDLQGKVQYSNHPLAVSGDARRQRTCTSFRKDHCVATVRQFATLSINFATLSIAAENPRVRGGHGRQAAAGVGQDPAQPTRAGEAEWPLSGYSYDDMVQ